MDTTTVLLFACVCGGAFIWGIVNVLKSHLLRDKEVHEDLVTVGVMLGATVTSFAIEFAWHGLPTVQMAFWAPFAITAALNIFIQYGQVKALKLEQASVVAPLASTMPLWVILASWLILGEYPTFWGKVGIVTVSVGAYVIALKGTPVELPLFGKRIIPKRYQETVLFYTAPWIRLFSSRGAQIALGIACLGAISSNFDKLATLASSPMVFTGGAFLVVAVFVYGWSKATGTWDTLDKTYFGRVFTLGLIQGVATVLMNTGYFFGIVPYVGSLKRTQIFWTVMLAGLFLGESHMGIRLVSALIIFVGAALMAF